MTDAIASDGRGDRHSCGRVKPLEHVQSVKMNQAIDRLWALLWDLLEGDLKCRRGWCDRTRSPEFQ